MSEEEIEAIAIWADNGAPLGNPADLPPPLEFAGENEWTIGEPDLILESPAVVVPASAPDSWTSLGRLETGLTEDRYVAAVEVREFNDVPKAEASGTVGGRYVFHHMNYGSLAPDAADGQRPDGWPVHEVGRNADVFPPEAGRILEAGSVARPAQRPPARERPRDPGAPEVRVQAAPAGLRAGGEVRADLRGQRRRHRHQAESGRPGAPCVPRARRAHQAAVVRAAPARPRHAHVPGGHLGPQHRDAVPAWATTTTG